MTPEQIDALLSNPTMRSLAQTGPEGPPQLTVVWYLWDGESFRFSTTRNRAKFHNIKRS
jgi:hypothetical protein